MDHARRGRIAKPRFLARSSTDRSDREATETCVDAQTCRELLVAARHVSRREADAEDLVQDVLLIAWRAGRADRPWLFGVLRRQAALQARSAGRARRRESVAATALDHSPPAAECGVRESPDWLQRLPPAGRRVVVLALHGLSAEEIRWLLGITPAAFRQRLAAIRKTLATLAPDERLESMMLAEVDQPARALDLPFGLVRRVLRSAMRGNGMGTHDGDGHLLVLHGRAHVPAPRGNG